MTYLIPIPRRVKFTVEFEYTEEFQDGMSQAERIDSEIRAVESMLKQHFPSEAFRIVTMEIP